MQITLLKGYPDMVGRRRIFCGYGTGPTSYNATTGDVLVVPGYETYIDAVFGGVQSVSGTYTIQVRPSLGGPRGTWSLHWFVTATGAEVTTVSATNLSAETVQIGFFGGQY